MQAIAEIVWRKRKVAVSQEGADFFGQAVEDERQGKAFFRVKRRMSSGSVGGGRFLSRWWSQSWIDATRTRLLRQ